ncbi:MAG: hypothetical protein HN390_17105 [Anaerolineae bacterium]|jgi:hypothetical protein|nr:hypothetical protein [Anaerolineae bacterium]MBT7189351.1 hypothetical protein [Anaerolineae bacterium]MBT7989980.1 hypothetical protein [Anaerolineae bacterium]
MGFLSRQFKPEITSSQFKFDVIFGLFAPILLIAVDLLVFEGFITDTLVFSYLLVIANLLALSFWLLFDVKLHPFLDALVAGILISGVLYASFMTYIVIYFAVWGSLVIVSLEGFMWALIGWLAFALLPILVDFVFLRNSIRALYKSYTEIGLFQLVILVTLSVLAMFFLTKETFAHLY